MVKTFVKYLTRGKVSSLIVTFFNEMGMSDYGSKRQGNFEIKKRFKCKVEYIGKSREYLCILSFVK